MDFLRTPNSLKRPKIDIKNKGKRKSEYELMGSPPKKKK